MNVDLSYMMPRPPEGMRFNVSEHKVYRTDEVWLNVDLERFKPYNALLQMLGFKGRWVTSAHEVVIPKNWDDPIPQLVAKKAKKAIEAYESGKGLDKYVGIYV